MTVKRYFAATARDCLRKVKEDLGPDAIVVSNKSALGGVEITAMSADSLEEISNRASATEYVGQERLVAAGGSRPAREFASKPSPEPSRDSLGGWFGTKARTGGATYPADDDYTVSLSTQARRFEQRAVPDARIPEVSPEPKRPTVSPWQPPRYEPATGKVTAALAAEKKTREPPAPVKPPSLPRSPNAESNMAVVQELTHEMRREMHDIRSLIEQQLAGFAWGELSRTSPARAQLMTELLEMGFSGVLARRMTQDLEPGAGLDEARKHASAVLDRRLRLFDENSDLVHRGGVYALVGPTGVGKTTTTAKLAARCVVRYGADRVALLTTDGYRIGAHEQLRIYGRILGVPVHAVNDAEELRQTLAALRDKHMVLIDTAGMSQRDRMVIEQTSMLSSSTAVKRLLLLNATSRGETLDEVIRAYGGEDIAACIFSKIDETTTLAPAVDAVARHGMPVAYLANGQRVPEDLHLPNRKYLLHRVFKQVTGNMAHRLKPEEVGMALAGNSGLMDLDDAID